MARSDLIRKPFAALAAKIAEGRITLGKSQAALAAELGFKQQAVSRWEAGTHRPTVAQIAALAALIGSDVAEIMLLAGYSSPVSASLSTQFPVDALDPATFEQFVADVVQELQPNAVVRVQGSRGHKQEGTDVVAHFPEGQVWSFQCKRVDRFGKSEVDKAIAYHSIRAERAFLVLSKIASPAAAEAVQAHEGWTLWDKQDLTRVIRSLPIETQERLVDIYFRGQRMALLGRSEPGPWLTSQEYFNPFKGRGAVFSHDWSLVGREREIDALVDVLETGDMPFGLLIGPGGIGKTRVLKEAIQRFAARNTVTIVRFLSNSQDPDAFSLYALGTGPKLLVVDDAHDREGLKLLIEYTVDPSHDARLLIATRPYAERRIRNELALYGIAKPSEVRLERLEKSALLSLAVEVLQEFGGSPDWADAILDIAADSPLVTAMAARIVARDGKIPELARGEQELRQIILARFTRVVTGDLGTLADAKLLRAVLEVLAIIQPFHIDDRRVADLVAATRTDIAAADVSRALKMLIEGGVIYKRGQLYRLMPDLLGDFLIEESCIGADERLTPFALEVANAVEGARLTQVLVNLGRMDWRRMEGDPSESDLLEPIWRKLRAIENKHDSRIDAVEAVAYYQPGKALEFVQSQIEQDRILPEFSGILRRVAFSPEYRSDALRLLWELGQNDKRDLNPHPNHPIRTLAGLIGYDRDKPLAFIEEVAEFGFSLLDDPYAWSGRYTPFDVLAPLLSGEGMTTTSTGRAISMSPFFVNYEAVSNLRARLVERIIALLQVEDSRTAHRAALFLQHAVRAPHGVFDSVASAELLFQYDQEFSRTIEKVRSLIARGQLAPTTIIGLIKSLSWYAQYDDGELGEQVAKIFDTIPYDLDFRFRASLANGAEYSYVGQVRYAEWEEDREWVGDLVTELLAAYPNPRDLCSALLAHCETLEAAGISTFPANQLVDKLIAADFAIGREIIDRSLSDSDSRLRNYLGWAVGALLENQPEEGRTLVSRMLASPEAMIRRGCARGLIGVRRKACSADIALLREVLSAQDDFVVSAAITALHNWHDIDNRETIALLLSVKFVHFPILFDSVGMLLCSHQAALLKKMREDEVRLLLERMMALPRLEGHWADEVLSGLAKKNGLEVAKFLLNRLDRAIENEAPEDYRAIGYSRRQGHIALHESPAAGEILEYSWLWLRRHDDAVGWARYQIAAVFAAMFKLDGDALVEFLNSMLDRATAGDLRWMADILRNGHHRFVFTHQGFVERYLLRCKAVEARLVKAAISQLGATAMSGIWSGTPGEPMPRDVQARDDANRVLLKLSRLSPAYALYRAILEDSRQRIERSIAEGEAMDAEE